MTPRRCLATGLVCWLIAAAAYGTLRLTFGPAPVYIHVRWAQAVDGQVRQWLERKHRLSQGEPLGGQTWGYTLLDPSSANIKALVRDASVDDTQNIDRATFRVTASAPRRPYLTSHAWIPVRLHGVSILCLLIGLVSISLGILEWARPGTAGRWGDAPRRDAIFALILLAALLLRLTLAMAAPYVHDEDNVSIPRSQLISFAPGNLQLPVRGQNHPALPSYFVKASSSLFGTTPLGYRLVHLLAGLGLIVMVFLLARQWYGPVAARWAAALLAFNEYYLGVSSRATAHVPYLLFTGSAVYAFGQFVVTQRVGYLYAAGGVLAVAFYAKEHSALLLPVFAFVLMQARYRCWFRSPHLYLACGLFALVIGPDLLWNLTAREGVEQATYGDHLQRIGGLGLSPYPFMFFARDAVQRLYGSVTGRAILDPTPEYWSMNSAIGALLLAAVLVTTVRRTAPETNRYLLILFWGVFGFFASIRPGGSPKDLDPASWIWVDVTLFPAVILTGALLADANGTTRIAAWAFAAAALVYAGALVVG